MKFQAPIQFQVASIILSPFPFAPHAGAGTRLATQKQALLQRSCFNFVKTTTNPSNEGSVFASQKLILLRRPRFLCVAKEKEAKKGDCGSRFGFAKLPSLHAVFRAQREIGLAATCGCAASNMQALIPRKTALHSTEPAGKVQPQLLMLKILYLDMKD